MWTGENDKYKRKSFRKRSKTAPFSVENGLVWTGPQTEGKSRLLTARAADVSFCDWPTSLENQ